MKLLKAFLIILILLSTGCAHYKVAKPLDPDVGFPKWFTEVDTLNPTLIWRPKFDGLADLYIFKGRKNGSCFNTAQKGASLVYSRLGLAESSHFVEETLEPNQCYFWTVAPTGESDDEEMGEYWYFAFYGIGFAAYWDLLFRFETPTREELGLDKKS